MLLDYISEPGKKCAFRDENGLFGPNMAPNQKSLTVRPRRRQTYGTAPLIKNGLGIVKVSSKKQKVFSFHFTSFYSRLTFGHCESIVSINGFSLCSLAQKEFLKSRG